MTKTFIETFKREAQTFRAHDIPALELGVLSGGVATVSVWACMALHQSVTGTPIGLDAVIMTPAVVFPIQAVLFGGLWLGGKTLDTFKALKKAQQFAAPSIDPQDLPGRAGPRPFY